MPAIPPLAAAALIDSLAAGDVPGALSALRAYSDLKQNDFPALDKKILSGLAADSASVRALAAASFDREPTLRRFARRFLPRLGEVGSRAAAFAIVESLLPLRPVADPQDGLLGAFSGYASPLGETLAARPFSREAPANGFYSPEDRFVQDAWEGVVAALGDRPFSLFVQVWESIQAIAHPYCAVPPPWPAEWCGGGDARGYGGLAMQAMQPKLWAHARAGDPALLAALAHWVGGEATLAVESDAGAGAVLGARYRALPAASRELAGGRFQETAADLLRALPVAQGARLYWHLRAAQVHPAAAKVVTARCDGYARERPREIGQRPPTPLPPLGPDAAPAAPAVEADEADPPLLAPHSGTPYALALFALMSMAEELGLPEVWDRLRASLRSAVIDDSDRPAAGPANPAAEAAIEAARAALEAQAMAAPQRCALLRAVAGVRADNGDERYVPDSAVETADWADALVSQALACSPGTRLDAALLLLPARLLAERADLWREAASELSGNALFGVRYSLLPAAVGRACALAPILEPLLARFARGEPLPAEDWQLAMARLYREGPAGRAACARVLVCAELPSPGMAYPRHRWNRPWRWLLRRAWELRDADFLALAVERLCLPLYFKSGKAFLPEGLECAADGYAPGEGDARAGHELPLTEVLAWIADRALASAARAAANAARCASEEKGAAAILAGFGRIPAMREVVAGEIGALAEMLEAPQDAAVKQGLQALADLSEALAPILDRVLALLARCVAAPAPGVTQAAAELLAALAQTYPERRLDCAPLLEELLFSDNAPTAVASMKALKILSQGRGGVTPHILSAEAERRVRALAAERPSKFGKLAAALLG